MSLLRKERITQVSRLRIRSSHHLRRASAETGVFSGVVTYIAECRSQTTDGSTQLTVACPSAVVSPILVPVGFLPASFIFHVLSSVFANRFFHMCRDEFGRLFSVFVNLCVCVNRRGLDNVLVIGVLFFTTPRSSPVKNECSDGQLAG